MNTNQFENLKKIEKKKDNLFFSVFSKIGFALFLSSIIAALILGMVVFIIKSEGLVNVDNMLVVGVVTNFLVVYPLVYIMLKHLRKQPTIKKDFSKKELFDFFLIGLAILYVGSIIGNILSGLLSHGASTNPINTLISGENLLLKGVLVCVLAPIFEELIFRKLFVDIITPYGEKVAIIFSAFCFALFHGSIFQIFYAFGLGILLGYVYIKSRKIIYTIILHCFFNFMGSAIPMILIKIIDIQKLSELASLKASSSMTEEVLREVFPSALVYVLYQLIVILTIIAGLVVFVKKRKSFLLQESESVSIKKEFLPMFFNVGTLLFIASCLYSIVCGLRHP